MRRLVLLVGWIVIASARVVHAQEVSIQSPGDGTAVSALRPAIAVAFSDAIPPDGRRLLRILVDDIDITEFAVWNARALSATVPVPLSDGTHRVEVRRSDLLGGWPVVATSTFQSAPPRHSVRREASFDVNATLEGQTPRAGGLTIAPHVDGAVDFDAVRLRYSATWNQQISFDAQQQFDKPQLVVQARRRALTIEAGFSRAEAFSESVFQGIRSYRRTVEARIVSDSAGTITTFTNFADGLPSAGGLAARRHWVQGLAWEPVFPDTRFHLVLLGSMIRERLGQQDDTLISSGAMRGWLVGAVGQFTISERWKTMAELAWNRSRNDPIDDASVSDTALRLALRGLIRTNTIEVKFSRIGTRFANPADPGLRPDRQDAEVVLASQKLRWNYRAFASFGMDALEGGVARTTEHRAGVSTGFELPRALDAAIDVEVSGLRSDQPAQGLWRVGGRLARPKGPLKFELASSWTSAGNPLNRTVSRDARGTIRGSPTGPLTLSLGAGVQWREGPAGPSSSKNLFVEPAWSFSERRGRLAFTLSAEVNTAIGSTGPRSSGRFNYTWDRQAGKAVDVSIGGDLGWIRARDPVSGRASASASATLRLVVSPRWATRGYAKQP